MPSIGWPELLIVLVIALVIFGPKRLPDMGRQLGRGLREFRKATSEIQDHFDLSLEDKDDKENETKDDVRPATATVAVAEATVSETSGEQTAAQRRSTPMRRRRSRRRSTPMRRRRSRRRSTPTRPRWSRARS